MRYRLVEQYATRKRGQWGQMLREEMKWLPTKAIEKWQTKWDTQKKQKKGRLVHRKVARKKFKLVLKEYIILREHEIARECTKHSFVDE